MQKFGIHTDIFEFDGRLNPYEFSNQLLTIGRVIDFKEIIVEHIVKLVMVK